MSWLPFFVYTFTTLGRQTRVSPIELNFGANGGIRPAHPEIIPADHKYWWGDGSRNGVYDYWRKGINL